MNLSFPLDNDNFYNSTDAKKMATNKTDTFRDPGDDDTKSNNNQV